MKLIKKNIFLFGSTGSIGVNTLNCIEYLPKELFNVVGLSCHKNSSLLLDQIIKHKPQVAYIENLDAFNEIKEKIPPHTKLYSKKDSLNKIINDTNYNTCINALVGSAGIVPTYLSISKQATILLANKETLVSAGDIIMKHAKKNNTPIIPIDSEHSAIFEMLKIMNNQEKELEKIILTASGGPFFFNKKKNPTLKEVLNHPTWNMGNKITVDSATMMNKGFEVIEAHYLFNLNYHQIEVIIHPKSIIHSFIELKDGNIYAQFSHNDMKRPIQNALTYPHILKNNLKKLSLSQLKEISFYEPDTKNFPLLKLAYDCGKKGGSYLTALNALNEVAVHQLLNKKINFIDIHPFIQKGIENHKEKINLSLEEILELDKKIKNNQ